MRKGRVFLYFLLIILFGFFSFSFPVSIGLPKFLLLLKVFLLYWTGDHIFYFLNEFVLFTYYLAMPHTCRILVPR